MENRPAPLRSRRVCRFCLTESEPLNYIYDREVNRPFQVPLTLQIMSCVSIEVYSADGMPQMICSTCRWNLDRSYKFKIQCKKADEALRAYPISGVLPRPFPPISSDPPESVVKRMRDAVPNEVVSKKMRLDNGDRDRERRDNRERDNQREKEERMYDEEQDEEPDVGHTGSNEKDDRKLEPGEIRVHACDQCDRTFPLKQALQLHVQRAHRDRSVKCTECERMFFSKYDLNKHMTTHADEKPFSCQICSKQFTRANLLQRHEKVHREELRYGCAHCEREFFSSDDLEKHEESVHKTVKPFQCNICNKRFTYKQGLERHELLHNEDKTFVCEYCKEAFRTSTKLARHLTSHAGHRPYLCKLCPRTFLLSHHLTRHMRSHSVEKRHQCEDCGKAFKRKESLEVHQLTHQKRGGMGLTCTVCQESCRNRADYVTHIKQHIEAGEKMGPDGLQPDNSKEKVETESDEEEEEERYSDGDDDYEPPAYVIKKMPKAKSQESDEEQGDRQEKESKEQDRTVVYVRGKDGNVLKKTIKTLMPIQRKDQEGKVKPGPSPQMTNKPIKQEESPKGRVDETEAQVQKIVASVFKEHKIPLKHNAPSETTNQSAAGQSKEELATPKSVNTVKMVKRVFVKKSADSPGVPVATSTPAVSKEDASTTATPAPTTSGTKVTKRVIVRRIIRQGDTTREVIMNPDGTIIDPAELAKLPTGNVVKRVVVKKPMDKNQTIASMLQSTVDAAQLIKATDMSEFSHIEPKQTQTTATPSKPTPVAIMRTETKQVAMSKDERETKAKLEQLEKRVEQQQLKIEELQARKQQTDYETDMDMLPERHDESEDEQQLPLKRVFVKRKQCIYDEEQEYVDDAKSKEVVESEEDKTEKSAPKDSKAPAIFEPRREKPTISSSRVYGNTKIILIKPDDALAAGAGAFAEGSASEAVSSSAPETVAAPADVEQMSTELCDILESSSTIREESAKDRKESNTTEADLDVEKLDENPDGGSFNTSEVEPMEQGGTEESGNSDPILKFIVTQNENNEVKLEFDESMENSENQVSQSDQPGDADMPLSSENVNEASDIYEGSETADSEDKVQQGMEESVVELENSEVNDTINLNDTTDSRDSLEDKLSQMEG